MNPPSVLASLESGIHSAEHVLNVLARLNQQALPAQIETSLTLGEEPEPIPPVTTT